MHSLKDCPLRSMAWLTVNKDNIVTHATEETIELLGLNPVNQSISAIWQPVDSPNNSEFDCVSTVSHTLCICTHMSQNNQKTIICTDITDLKNHMFVNSNEPTMITRLTMYGTIEATYSVESTATTDYCIGQPMMRYIHSEDVQLFCAGLNEATKTSSIAHFQIRLLANTNSITWSQFTVMLLPDQKILCFIQPIQEQEAPVTHFYQCSNVLQGTLSAVQFKFWYAIDHGMNVLAKHLASSLIGLFQTIWCIWHENDDQLIRNWVQSTKSSTEIDRLCHLVSYLGIPPNTTKSWLDLTLDQTSEWLLTKSSTVQYLYDHIL